MKNFNLTLKAIGTMLLIFFQTSAFSQAVPKTLSIGDTVPQIILRGYLKDSTRTKKLSDYYKNKLLLIDLSATWCSPCVKAWPQLDSFKQAFTGQLEVLIISQEKRANVKRFFRVHPELKFGDLDFITDNYNANRILDLAFPHKMVPEVIWVTSEGRIIAETSGDQVTKENISKALKNQLPKLRIRKDVMDFDFFTYHLSDSIPLESSMITKRKEGIPAGASYQPAQNLDEAKNHNKLLFLNLDVKKLYTEAAFHHTISDFNTDRVLVELPDSIRIKYDPSFWQHSEYKTRIDWYLDNTYCYELQMSRLMPVAYFYNRMINELNSYFKLNGRFVKRDRPCWVLKSSEKTEDLLRTKNGTPKVTYHLGVIQSLQNQPVDKLIYYLNRCISSDMVVNETQLNSFLDIDLSGLTPKTPPETIAKILSKYGLSLAKEIRSVEVFLISN